MSETLNPSPAEGTESVAAPDITDTTTPTELTVEALQAELENLKAKSADLADQFLRAKADAENARRRAEDEISKARKFAVESFR